MNDQNYKLQSNSYKKYNFPTKVLLPLYWIMGLTGLFLIVSFTFPLSSGLLQNIFTKSEADAEQYYIGQISYLYTYQETASFNGSKASGVAIYVNDTEVAPPDDSRHWDIEIQLVLGINKLHIHDTDDFTIGTVTYEKHGKGDIDMDGDVDIFDLGIIVSYFGREVDWRDEGNLVFSDITRDGVINVYDFGMLSGLFGNSHYDYPGQG